MEMPTNVFPGNHVMFCAQCLLQLHAIQLRLGLTRFFTSSTIHFGCKNLAIKLTFLQSRQHPNLPAIGHAQSVLMRDSFVRDSFTKDTLLRAWDQLPLAQFFTSGEVGL